MRALTLWLLCVALLAVIVWIVPEPEACWIPPNAPTRGFYADCWQPSELWS